MKQIFLKYVCAALFIVMIAGGQLHVSAAELNGIRLTEKQETTLNMGIYSAYGERMGQPKFRSDGDYEWKWMNRNALWDNLWNNGKGTYYAYDYSNAVYAIDTNGQRQWMVESDGHEIDEFQSDSAGNLYMYSKNEKSLLNIEGAILKETSTGLIRVMNSSGEFQWSVEVVQPYQFGGSYTFDWDENLIALQREGIFSYDKFGRANWSFTDFIKIEEDDFGGTVTNVADMGMDDTGHVYVLTDSHFLTIDANGKLVTSKEIEVVRVKIGEDSFLNAVQVGEGRYLWGNEELTEEELIAAYNQFIATINGNAGDSILNTVRWSGGSYSGRDNNTLIAKDTKGNVKWTYQSKKYYGAPSSIVVDSQGNVFFTDNGGNIYGLDAKGNEKFRLNRDDDGLTPTNLALTPEGNLIGITEGIGMFLIGKSSIGVSIEGEKVSFDQEPILEKGTTLVPFRPIFEKLGLKVGWDAGTQTVTGSKEGLEIRLKIGQSEAQVNGKKILLKANPSIVSGNTYIPLRFIGESMGLEVEWDAVDREVRIGHAEMLAEEAVKRFLLHLEQGDDAKATADLSDSSTSVIKVFPGMQPYFEKKKWVTDIRSIQSVRESDDVIKVQTVQRNRTLYWDEVTDNVQENWYKVKKIADGRWKILDSDLLHTS